MTHCMHDEPGSQRVCCWCGMRQKQAVDKPDGHGPHIPQSAMSWHWEPRTVGVICTARLPTLDELVPAR